jgi:hypothetical protein
VLPFGATMDTSLVDVCIGIFITGVFHLYLCECTPLLLWIVCACVLRGRVARLWVSQACECACVGVGVLVLLLQLSCDHC